MFGPSKICAAQIIPWAVSLSCAHSMRTVQPHMCCICRRIACVFSREDLLWCPSQRLVLAFADDTMRVRPSPHLFAHLDFALYYVFFLEYLFPVPHGTPPVALSISLRRASTGLADLTLEHAAQSPSASMRSLMSKALFWRKKGPAQALEQAIDVPSPVGPLPWEQ
jgi:hypothetical protein